MLLDNVKDSDFGLVIQDFPVIPTSSEKIEYIDVPYRNGPLTKISGYEKRDYEVLFTLADTSNIKSSVRKAKAFFLNRQKLSFDDDVGFYQEVLNIDIGDIERQVVDVGYFTVMFSVSPFDYAVTSSQSFNTSPISLTNIGTFESNPLIKITGTGNVVLTVNGASCQFKDLTAGVILDCQLKEAYWGSTLSMNSKMSGDFPVFKIGKNTISYSGSVTKVEIDGRWRYV